MEIRKEYRRFNAVGTQQTVRLNPISVADTNPVRHFLAGVKDMFQHALQNVRDADMVGIAFHKDSNRNDRPIGLCFRRRHQLPGDVIWSVFEMQPSQILDLTLWIDCNSAFGQDAYRIRTRLTEDHRHITFGNGPSEKEYHRSKK